MQKESFSESKPKFKSLEVRSIKRAARGHLQNRIDLEKVSRLDHNDQVLIPKLIIALLFHLAPWASCLSLQQGMRVFFS